MLINFIQKEIENNGTKYNKAILCSIVDGEDIVSCSSLCQDSTLFTKYRNLGISLNFFIDPIYQIPSVSLSDVSSNSYSDVTSVYNLIEDYLNKQKIDELPDSVSQVLVKKLCTLGLSKETAAYSIASCLDLLQYRKHGTFSGIIAIRPDYFDSDLYEFTSSFISSNNRDKINPFTLISEADDVTKFQNVCTDPLFIRIPLPHEIVDNVSLASMLPTRNEVSNPYGSKELKDMTTYKDIGSTFSTEDYVLIEGNSQNNDLEIQENEKVFYQSLVDWVKFNMKHEYGDNVDTDPSNPNIDLTSQEFLLELLEMFYIWYWKHNPNVPDINEEFSEDSDDDSSNISSKYIFKANEEEKSWYRQGFNEFSTSNLHINAIELLKNFVKKASLSIGYRAYVDAIIKLARWGERKCTAISYPDYPKVFYLGTNMEKEKLGNIEDYQIQQVNGADYEAVCLIYESIMLTDKKYFRSLGYDKNHLCAPIGLYAVKHIVNEATGKKIDVNMNFSMIDVVRLIKEGKCPIANIDYKDGKFIVPEVMTDDSITASKLISKYKGSEDDIVQEHFFRSQELQDLYLEYNAIQGNVPIKPNHFTILQNKYSSTNISGEFSRQKFESKIDFDNKRSSGALRSSVSTILETNIASVILPVYIEVSKRFEDGMTFSDIIELYSTVMIEMGYSNETMFLSDKNTVDQGSAESVQKMDLFSEEPTAKPVPSEEPVANSKVAVESTAESNTPAENVQEKTAEVPVASVEKVKLSLIKSISNDEMIYPLVAKDNTIIGGFALTKGINANTGKTFNIFTLVDINTYNSSQNKGPNSISLYKLLPNLVYNLCAIESGKEELVRIYFNSTSAMNYYLGTVNSLVKEQNL